MAKDTPPKGGNKQQSTSPASTGPQSPASGAPRAEAIPPAPLKGAEVLKEQPGVVAQSLASTQQALEVSGRGLEPLGAQPQPTPIPASVEPTISQENLEALREQLSEERRRRESLEREQARLEQMIAEKFARMEARQQQRGEAMPSMAAPAPASADKALVVNNGAAPIYVPDVLLPTGLHLTLGPGVNMIPREAWAEAKAKKTIRQLLEVGAHPFSKQGLREAGTGDVATLSEEQALLLVASSTDLEQLGAWHHRESRPMVRAAMASQLEILRKRHEQIAAQMAEAHKAGEVKVSRTR